MFLAGAVAEDCGTFDLGCKLGNAARSAFASIVDAAAEAAANVVVEAASWWVTTPSVDPQDSAVIAAQAMTQPVILIMLVGSMLVQAIRVLISRKGEPAVAVFFGLVRFAVVSAAGLAVLQGALLAGDALSEHILNGAANNFAFLMRDVLSGEQSMLSLFLLLILSLIALVLGLIQWILMALRQAGLLVLAAMLPLAASGSLTKSTRVWLDRLAPWLIALVGYKPAAAFIYYIGFSYLSTTNSNKPGGLGTAITGIMVLFLAVLAMPLMMRFFSWSSVQVAGGGGGGGAMAGVVGAVALAGYSGRSSAVQQATYMDASGPGSGSTARSTGQPPPAGAAPVGGAAAAAGGPAGAAVAGAAVATEAAKAPGRAARSAGRHMTGDDQR